MLCYDKLCYVTLCYDPYNDFDKSHITKHNVTCHVLLRNKLLFAVLCNKI